MTGITRRRHCAAVAAAVMALAIGACGDSGSPSSSTSSSDAAAGPIAQSEALTIGSGSQPLSLDPAKNGNTIEYQYYMALAYEPLIRLKPDGKLGPGLATSWRYTDKSLRRFELTLRPGAKFSDGEPVTPQSVVDSLEYVRRTKGPVSVYINAVKSAKAVGEDKVELTLRRSDPTIAFLLTQRWLIGQIISPKGVKNPKALGTSTAGAGQYMLDPAATVAGDHYTFVQNPNFYDQKAVHFKKVTIRVIKNPQTALAALQSGQIDFTTGGYQLAPTAKSMGLNVTSTTYGFNGVFLFDRDGAVSKPLASQKVRQALNYATDRKGITQAIFGDYGTPTASEFVNGYENQGYVPEAVDRYPHDPAKAKQLLAEAGYADGFTLTLGASAAYGDGANMAQAIANDWAKVGVKVKIKQYPDIPSLVPPWLDKKLPAVAGDYGGQPGFIFAQQSLLTDAGLYNPWKSEDSQLSALMEKAFATTDLDQQGPAWGAVTNRLVELAWNVPVTAVQSVYFSSKKLKGVKVSPLANAQDPTQLYF